MKQVIVLVLAASGVACGAQVAPAPERTAVPSGLLSGATLPLSVALTPACARPGEPVRAQAQTQAGAEVVFIATYPSGGADPDTKTVTAAPSGSARFEWLVPAEAQPGEAALITQAKTDAKEATFVTQFKIGADCS